MNATRALAVAVVASLLVAACSSEDATVETASSTTATSDPSITREPIEHSIDISAGQPIAAFDSIWVTGNAGDTATVRAPALVRFDPDDDGATRIDLGDEIVAEPITEDDPGGWFGGVAADAEYVYMVVDDRLVRIDPARGAVDGEWALPGGLPCCLAAADGVVWVLTDFPDESKLVRVDTRSGETVTFDVPVGLKNIAVGADSVWVTEVAAGALHRYAFDGSLATTIPVLPRPAQVSVAADGVWVTSQSAGAVQRIDPSTNEVATTIDLNRGSEFSDSVEAFGLTVTDEWVVVALHRIDDDAAFLVPIATETLEPGAEIPIGTGYLHEFAVAGDTAFAPEPYFELLIDPDEPPPTTTTEPWEPAPLLEIPVD